MAKKDMNRRLTSLIITEIQIKTTMRYCLTPAIVKNLQTIHAGECVKKMKPSYTVGGKVNWYSHCGKQYGVSLKKKKKIAIKPPYDPAIPLLGIYPEETKIEKYTCIPLFIATLFTIAWHFLVAQMVKRVPAMWETWVGFLGREDPLEKEMATHSSILA